MKISLLDEYFHSHFTKSLQRRIYFWESTFRFRAIAEGGEERRDATRVYRSEVRTLFSDSGHFRDALDIAADEFQYD